MSQRTVGKFRRTQTHAVCPTRVRANPDTRCMPDKSLRIQTHAVCPTRVFASPDIRCLPDKSLRAQTHAVCLTRVLANPDIRCLPDKSLRTQTRCLPDKSPYEPRHTLGGLFYRDQLYSRIQNISETDSYPSQQFHLRKAPLRENVPVSEDF